MLSTENLCCGCGCYKAHLIIHQPGPGLDVLRAHAEDLVSQILLAVQVHALQVWSRRHYCVICVTFSGNVPTVKTIQFTLVVTQYNTEDHIF